MFANRRLASRGIAVTMNTYLLVVDEPGEVGSWRTGRRRALCDQRPSRIVPHPVDGDDGDAVRRFCKTSKVIG